MTSRNRCHGAGAVDGSRLQDLGRDLGHAGVEREGHERHAHPDDDDRGDDEERAAARTATSGPGSRRPSSVSSQFTRPYWVSNIHCQTTVAVSGRHRPGQQQADADERCACPCRAGPSSRAIERAHHHGERRRSRRRTAASAAAPPRSRVGEDLAEVVEADRLGRGAELLAQPELLRRHDDQPEQRVPEHHAEDHQRRRQQQRTAAAGAGGGPRPAAPDRRDGFGRSSSRQHCVHDAGAVGGDGLDASSAVAADRARRSLRVEGLLDGFVGPLRLGPRRRRPGRWRPACPAGCCRPSTAAQCSLDGTNRLFSAAAAWAWAAASPLTSSSSDLRAGIRPGSANCRWYSSLVMHLEEVERQLRVRAVGRDGQVRAAEEHRRRLAGTRAGQGEGADLGFHLGRAAVLAHDLADLPARGPSACRPRRRRRRRSPASRRRRLGAPVASFMICCTVSRPSTDSARVELADPLVALLDGDVAAGVPDERQRMACQLRPGK